MSTCTRNRWGTGNQSCYKDETKQSNELVDKLKKMNEERNKQDTMWITPIQSTSSSTLADNKLRGRD